MAATVKNQGRTERNTPLWEWQTVLALAGCYGAWGAVTWFHADLGPVAFCIAATWLTAFHSSLQHEALHGHPTRSARLNEALVYPALGLFVPYRRFRTTHLRHHCDERLTDPHDDPESWYVTPGDWRALGPAMRVVLTFNATLAGRLAIGPALAIVGLVRSDIRAMTAGDRTIRRAWLHHGLGLVPVVAWLSVVCGVDLVTFAVFTAYPAMSLLMLRAYAEHRAHEDTGQRTAIVETSPVFALLFLNNNLHSVHHDKPRAPWYRLPSIYRERRNAYLAANGSYGFNGYRDLFARHLFRPANTVIHPLLGKTERSLSHCPDSRGP